MVVTSPFSPGRERNGAVVSEHLAQTFTCRAETDPVVRRVALPCLPCPSSRTCRVSVPPSRRATISMRLAFGSASIPCRTAFSTIGCKRSVGTRASSTSGAAFTRTESRSPKRICSIARYRCARGTSSRGGGTSTAPSLSRTSRREVAEPGDHRDRLGPSLHAHEHAADPSGACCRGSAGGGASRAP